MAMLTVATRFSGSTYEKRRRMGIIAKTRDICEGLHPDRCIERLETSSVSVEFRLIG